MCGWLALHGATLWQHPTVLLHDRLFLETAIIGLLEFNLFGIPYNGADICGFFGKTSPALCMRWLQLGAFYGLWRSHSMKHSGFQDPPMLGDDVVKGTIRVHNTRYSMLPYLYTLFYRNSIRGGTVARSMMAEFYLNEADPVVLEVHDQFMFGKAVLVAPALYEGVNDVTVYLPAASNWYDWYTGRPFNGGQYVMIHIPLYDETPPVGDNPEGHHVMRDIGLFLRGGYIVPLQEPANNTRFSRLQPMGAVVALNSDGDAEGELFWDDGESADTVERGEYHHITFIANVTNDGNVAFHIEQTKRHSSIDGIPAGEFKMYGVPSFKRYLYYRSGSEAGWTSQKSDYTGETRALRWSFGSSAQQVQIAENMEFVYTDQFVESLAFGARPSAMVLLLLLLPAWISS